MEEDTDYFEAWDAQPKSRTYDERKERRLEKRDRAAAKHRAAEMRGAENREGGALNKNAGTTVRGAYGVGGSSTRTVQANKKKLRDTFNSGSLRISEDEFKRSWPPLTQPGLRLPLNLPPSRLPLLAHCQLRAPLPICLQSRNGPAHPL
ncbi:hypothetical protein B0H19DRAFT_1083043 [Mycena capillaripes]|nr:hypothetical protein B0H19DRAFT_1083043 [Mycena capillaripes]